jgi:hypothetical protein
MTGRLKKTFLIGCILCIGLVAMAGMVRYSHVIFKVTQLDDESRAFVDKVTPMILANPNKAVLFEFAGEELRAASADDLERIYSKLISLGAFNSYGGSTGRMVIFKDKPAGVYTAKAEFETGPVSVNVTVTKKSQSDVWRVVGFDVTSAALQNAN